MNKWIYRLIGVLVLALVALLFLDFWLKPKVPEAIENEIGMEVVDGEGQPIPQRDPSEGNEGLSLLSLESDDNTQGNVAANGGTPPAHTTTNQSNNTPAETPAEPEMSLTSLEDDVPVPVLSNPDSTRANAWLQAGSFGSRENADNRAVLLRGQGLSTDIEQANVNGKTYYRVYVGPLQRSAVDQTLGQLQGLNIEAREVSR
ncbi:SPOR domain-containing protein [Suttonella sp. R2A3]|uniref:SPOR domain-containing protein n=1 Tax=Suttonella sp. R2A3 TaxID=2908648 RepID=UPI001F20104C|nr:SPOR domain-containing protein [Suttonella sp. R2A3]UJF24729.1 SPOR domain-containing protein [Suttonella sp. R2A3]